MITFAKYEIVRTLRNRRFFIFSVGFPTVLYFVIASPNRNEHNLTQNLTNVGVMLQSLDRHSEVSARVLRQVRDGMQQQEKKFLGQLRGQNRLTMLLLSGIVLTISALAATGMLGYFGFNVLSHFVK